jgi:hypothetical protein
VTKDSLQDRATSITSEITLWACAMYPAEFLQVAPSFETMHLSLDVMVFHFAPVHFVVCDSLSRSCFETVTEDFLKLML